MKPFARSKLRHELAGLVTNQRGVTLLEVLIVIMIMGFVATLGSIQLTRYFSRARVDTAKLQMNEIGVALDLFKIDVGRFPDSSGGLQLLLKTGVEIPGWRGPYIKRDNILKDPWGRAYVYSTNEAAGTYRLASLGGDGQPGGEGDNADIVTTGE